MTFERIDKVGLEVEGGWTTIPSDPGVSYDGSVNVSGYRPLELVSSPFPSLTEAQAWLRRIYPNATNNTCGFHVHFSFRNPNDYARLMDKDFYDYFLAEIRKWAVEEGVRNTNFWHRLAGDCTYCRRGWNPDVQVAQRGKSGYRYAHWNFCHRLHGTAECRLLPTFKSVGLAEKALEALCRIVEDYLADGPEQVGYVKIIDEDPS